MRETAATKVRTPPRGVGARVVFPVHGAEQDQIPHTSHGLALQFVLHRSGGRTTLTPEKRHVESA
jgi:hypothetical protein